MPLNRCARVRAHPQPPQYVGSKELVSISQVFTSQQIIKRGLFNCHLSYNIDQRLLVNGVESFYFFTILCIGATRDIIYKDNSISSVPFLFVSISHVVYFLNVTRKLFSFRFITLSWRRYHRLSISLSSNHPNRENVPPLQPAMSLQAEFICTCIHVIHHHRLKLICLPLGENCEYILLLWAMLSFYIYYDAIVSNSHRLNHPCHLSS